MTVEERCVVGSTIRRDGVEVRLRQIHRTDAGALVRFHHGLSPETTRWRFFTFHPELSPKELDRFTHVDHHRREAIVAVVDGEIIGVGRYDRIGEGPVAEVAFVVTDAWQGKGIAAALFDALRDRAVARGITRFSAVTLPDNHRMLRTFRRTGLPMASHFEDGSVAVTLELTPVPADQHDGAVPATT